MTRIVLIACRQSCFFGAAYNRYRILFRLLDQVENYDRQRSTGKNYSLRIENS